MLSCSSFGLLVLRVSLHDVRDFYMRLMMQGNSPRHDLVTGIGRTLLVRLSSCVRGLIYKYAAGSTTVLNVTDHQP